MTSARMSNSSGTPGRPANSTSTISSKLNSQNGSFKLRGLRTSERSPKQRPYSLCTSSRKIRKFGRDLRISFSSSDTPLDLPTPVEPSTAKCFESISSTSTQAMTEGACCKVPTEICSGPGIGRAQLLIGNQLDGIADRGIVGDTALEFGAVRPAEDFAEQIDRGTGNISVGRRQVFAGYLRDHRDDGRICAADADEPSDGCPYFRGGYLAHRQQSGPGEGS